MATHISLGACLQAPTVPGWTVIATLVLAASCGSQQTRESFISDTTYQRRVAHMEQLSHAVPTDSLIRLYLRMADASPADAGRIGQELSCEILRGALRYGTMPSSIARARAFDSLRTTKSAAFDRAIDKYNNLPGGTTTSRYICNAAHIAIAPESLDVMPVPTAILRKYPIPPK
jgi:hypothetical protein